MSHGVDILEGREVPGFSQALPISEKNRRNWLGELNRLGRPAIKAFDRGTMAARILAGRFPEKFEEEGGPRPFILNARRGDIGRSWFLRGFTLLVIPLDIEISHDALVNPTETAAEAAYHFESDALMTSERMKRMREHNYAELPRNTIEVVRFSIVTPEDYQDQPIEASVV